MTLQLFNADCLEKMKDLSDNSIDLIICDLPYGCLTGGGGEEKRKIKGKLMRADDPTKPNNREGVIAGCSWDIKINLVEFWKQVKRIRKDDHTPTLHFCSTKFGYDLIQSNEKEFRYDLVWCKPNAVGFLSANKKPMSSHEMIYVFSKQGANYNRIDLIGDFPKSHSKGNQKLLNVNTYNGGQPLPNTPSVDNSKFRCVKSWFEIPNKKEKGGHPTAKPHDIYKWLIERYSKEGDMVLDSTFGSCNSGAVCRELNRNFIGIEMNKEFYDKAVERLINN